MSTRPSPLQSLIRDTGQRIADQEKQGERRRQCVLADQAATQARPAFYANLVRYPIRDPGIAEALCGTVLPPWIERRVSWSLMRMFAARLRSADRYPRLPRPTRILLQIAIRCEVRRWLEARRRERELEARRVAS